MPFRFLLLALLGLSGLPLHAVQVTLESPDRAQTFVYGSLVDRRLGWDASQKLFYAEVTFSNERYAGFGEKLERESFRFTFPGVNYDEKTKAFFVMTNTNRRIDVAKVTPRFIGSSILPMQTSLFRVQHPRGQVVVILDIDTDRTKSKTTGTTNETYTIPLKEAFGP
jgi:hypothetical protein